MSSSQAQQFGLSPLQCLQKHAAHLAEAEAKTASIEKAFSEAQTALQKHKDHIADLQKMMQTSISSYQRSITEQQE